MISNTLEKLVLLGNHGRAKSQLTTIVMMVAILTFTTFLREENKQFIPHGYLFIPFTKTVP